jgi:cell division protein FtsB
MDLSKPTRTRRSVGLPDETDFIEPQYRILYKNFWERFNLKYLFIVSVYIFFTLRVIFMDGGYLDLQEKMDAIALQEGEILSTKNENEAISTEIKKIKKNKKYQKKLVREHLGVIAADEQVLLFRSDLEEGAK